MLKIRFVVQCRAGHLQYSEMQNMTLREFLEFESINLFLSDMENKILNNTQNKPIKEVSLAELNI